MARPKLVVPAQGPPWLPPYTQSIERAISQAIATSGASSVTGSFTVTDLDGEKVFLILMSGLRVTLPSAAGNTAKLTFKLMVPGNFTLISEDRIDGGNFATLSTQYEAVTLFSGGSDWVILMAYQPMTDVVSALADATEVQVSTLAALKALLFLQAQAIGSSPDDPDMLIAEFRSDQT